ncbi:hypothetical protein HW555_007201 [Spodoptera exigua]|uniref:Tectonic domain-containing protein n=1 Tax=Spodoptera exigua TaxID=7107 RepID=A0A835L2V7_SPOEX|nr:hypothetical protein HW555_007201 [Spodoptera exigua]
MKFCVMDYIQEKIQTEELLNLSVTTQKQILNDLLKNISSKPHALYYRTLTSKSLKKVSPSKLYNNSTMPDVSIGTTDGSTTVFDVLYDENTSDIEVATSTTEMYYTSTEFDNITEITFFETKNNSSSVPSHKPKFSHNMPCECNLLYKVCDINCCCDEDCSDTHYKLFQCQEPSKGDRKSVDGCVTHLLDEQKYGGSMLDDLFCIVKTNLPSKRNIKKASYLLNLKRYDEAPGVYYKWESSFKKHHLYEFKKALYKRGDPIWILKNGIIYYLDFPASMMNSYCTDRVPITFLKEEKMTCNVKLTDLEMFNILKTSEEAMVISATNNTINSTTLNCTTLHCINWTILMCENGFCKNYNKTQNEASCTEEVCTNIALKVEYEFYYYDFKIMNATIKLHVQNISNALPLMMQEVRVHFYMANKSIEHVIELSGNLGYINGLPVIASYAGNNYTEHFFNNTSEIRSLILPENRNGLCVRTNTSNNFAKFGVNKRTKCRYTYSPKNKTKQKLCNNIQADIYKLLRLNNNISISPFGNPQDITDDKWLHLELDKHNLEPVYGDYNENTLKLYCYNLINRLSITFMYAKVDENSHTEQNKIVSAKYEATMDNLTFSSEDISFVITIDINFVDLSKPSDIEYAGGPHINIHLPKDFFFPFPQNSCIPLVNTCFVTICCYVMLFFANKITLG